ncbi:hypothetical protein NX869_30880, partial [Burkholderia thailandensis]|uniref:hypothetical protein n=1 Tax=Burkholderia thailandensis TaxID=57975 RepID=UPI00217CE8AF
RMRVMVGVGSSAVGRVAGSANGSGVGCGSNGWPKLKEQESARMLDGMPDWDRASGKEACRVVWDVDGWWMM